jgi:hypothetical protein
MRRSFVLGFLTAALLAGHSGIMQAQIEGIGVLVGPSISSFRGNGSDAFNSQTGFVAGGFVEIGFSGGMIGLRPELLYVQKGATTNTTPSTKFKIEYIEVPVLLTVDVPLGGILGLELYGGPQISFLSTCKADVQNGASGVPCVTEGLPLKSTDWGLIFGGELAIKMFLVGVRYDMGLTQIVDNPNINLKNQALMITAGVLFHFPGMGG